MKRPVQLLRHLLVVIGGVVAGEQAVEAIGAWQEWHTWVHSDPSAADAYRTFFWLNSAAAVVSVTLAALLWHLLRPKGPTS
jgi:hypothetical protein